MADRSRMNREVHVRICEGLGVKFPRATRLSLGKESAIRSLNCRLKKKLCKSHDILGDAELILDSNCYVSIGRV